MITIAQKLRPFSTLPATKILIPGSSARATIYPARVDFDDLSGVEPKPIGTYSLPLKGPIDTFTTQLDLEKQRVLVWGESQEGFFRYSITGNPVVSIAWEKGRADDAIEIGQAKQVCERPQRIERLTLGCHKKQDWAQVLRRFAMEEIFPFWFYSAQLIPKQPPAIYDGAASLLPACCQAIIDSDRPHLLEPFRYVLRAGFEGILSPRLTDDDHYGFDLKELKKSSKANPLSMMVDGALLIRSLFIQREKGHTKILPALPVDFHSGRLIHVACGGDGFLDMEWTKKTIRRMVFLAQKDGEMNFAFQKGLKKFRLYSESKSKAKTLKTTDSIIVEKGNTYILDRFEK